ESIATGDSDYNEAVDLLNDKNYDESRNKAISASNNFNKSISQLTSIKDNFTSSTDDVYKSYVNTLLEELKLKLNATDYLMEAIDYFENYQNSTGNSYAYEANELMNDALEFQKVRNDLVKDNPDLFK
ncbi:MAG: hypothetical protein IJ104_09005, partial [Methanobrevibacter sp.]|nr:hypothetical protein [Methanobrevibacter sp.]